MSKNPKYKNSAGIIPIDNSILNFENNSILNSKEYNAIQEGGRNIFGYETGLVLGIGNVDEINNIKEGLENLVKIKRRHIYKLLLGWTQQKPLGFFSGSGRVKNAVKRIEAFEEFIDKIYKHDIGREDNFIDVKTFNKYPFKKQSKIIMSLAYILVKTSSIGDKYISDFAIELERLISPDDFKKPPAKDKETKEYKNEKRRKRQTDTYAINLVKEYICTKDPSKNYDEIVKVAQDLWQQILDKEVKIMEAEAERKKTENSIELRKQRAQKIINNISARLPGLTETRTKDALEKTKIRTALQEIVNRYYKIFSDTDNIAFEIKTFQKQQNTGMSITEINKKKKQIIDKIFKILREARELLDYLSSASLSVNDNKKELGKEISNTLSVLIQHGGSNEPAVSMDTIINKLKVEINTLITKLTKMVSELNKTSAEYIEKNLDQVIDKLEKKEEVLLTMPDGRTKHLQKVHDLLTVAKQFPYGYFNLTNSNIIIGDGQHIIGKLDKDGKADSHGDSGSTGDLGDLGDLGVLGGSGDHNKEEQKEDLDNLIKEVTNSNEYKFFKEKFNEFYDNHNKQYTPQEKQDILGKLLYLLSLLIYINEYIPDDKRKYEEILVYEYYDIYYFIAYLLDENNGKIIQIVQNAINSANQIATTRNKTIKPLIRPEQLLQAAAAAVNAAAGTAATAATAAPAGTAAPAPAAAAPAPAAAAPAPAASTGAAPAPADAADAAAAGAAATAAAPAPAALTADKAAAGAAGAGAGAGAGAAAAPAPAPATGAALTADEAAAGAAGAAPAPAALTADKAAAGAAGAGAGAGAGAAAAPAAPVVTAATAATAAAVAPAAPVVTVEQANIQAQAARTAFELARNIADITSDSQKQEYTQTARRCMRVARDAATNTRNIFTKEYDMTKNILTKIQNVEQHIFDNINVANYKPYLDTIKQYIEEANKILTITLKQAEEARTVNTNIYIYLKLLEQALYYFITSLYYLRKVYEFLVVGGVDLITFNGGFTKPKYTRKRHNRLSGKNHKRTLKRLNKKHKTHKHNTSHRKRTNTRK